MERPPVGMDELVEHWTVLGDERDLVAGKRGATRLGFALLLKFYTRYGRFPRGRAELPDEVVEHLARQVRVPAADIGFYEWSGSTFDYHRKQVREHLDFRECSVADAEKLTDWLAANVAHAERDPDKVRVELLKKMRLERIEPPADGRAGRMVASALRTAELTWFATIPARLDAAAGTRVLALVGWGEDGQEDEDEDPESVLALIKSMPGNVSLESMLTEIRKLRAARGIGLPGQLFSDVAPKVVASWRGRAAVESPSHLRRRPADSAVTMLAALVHERCREITDDLAELLIATVHRIDARAHRKVTDELVNAFKRVDGKENLLFAIAEAALAKPEGTVAQVVYPAVRGGEQTLRELVHEYKTKGPVYRRTVFGITRLLDIDLLPRIKRINTVRLYRPGPAGAVDRFARLAPALHRPIRWDLIDENYDQVVKYATAIKTGTASAEAVLSRFTGAASHPAYQAMLEIGKAQRTLFVARYLLDRDLQRQIESGLNVVEAWNRANAVICYGKSGEISTNRREEVEMTALCLRILQASLVFVNTLMLQDVLAEEAWSALLTPADRRGLSPLFWQHVRPYGEVILDLGSRLSIGTRS